jgi:nucleotide-binding universal stress UspA family protein
MYQRILVPIDGSPTADRGLDEAIRLAALSGASIRLLHVLDAFSFATGLGFGVTYTPDVLSLLREGGEAILAERRGRVAAAGVGVDSVLLEGLALPTADIVVGQCEAWKADLIVIGTHGRRGVRRLLLGSDAEQIVRSAKVPVLLVRADESTATDALLAPTRTAAKPGARVTTATA